MALKIIDDCTNCGVCIDECPNDAISEGDEIFEIDPELCTECVGFYDSPQCQDVCPVEAIVEDPDHQESHEELLEKKKKTHGE